VNLLKTTIDRRTIYLRTEHQIVTKTILITSFY